MTEKRAGSPHFTVGKATDKGVFRDIKTGRVVTRVMDERVYEKATGRADAKIREFVQDSRKARGSR